jgi:hypothetical protein
VLEFLTRSALPFSHDLSISQSLKLALPSSPHLLSRILAVVRLDTHDPSAVGTFLTKHTGDYDSDSLATRSRYNLNLRHPLNARHLENQGRTSRGSRVNGSYDVVLRS